MLSTLSTIFEKKKAIVTRWSSFMEYFYLLLSKPYGFRITKDKSTIHSIHNVITNTKNSMDGDNQTLAIVMDIKKACDMVCHQKLIWKLEKYGIRATP